MDETSKLMIAIFTFTFLSTLHDEQAKKLEKEIDALESEGGDNELQKSFA